MTAFSQTDHSTAQAFGKTEKQLSIYCAHARHAESRSHLNNPILQTRALRLRRLRYLITLSQSASQRKNSDFSSSRFFSILLCPKNVHETTQSDPRRGVACSTKPFHMFSFIFITLRGVFVINNIPLLQMRKLRLTAKGRAQGREIKENSGRQQPCRPHKLIRKGSPGSLVLPRLTALRGRIGSPWRK